MNRVVISVPRVLDSALVVTQDNELQVNAPVPAVATAPFTVNSVKAAATETQISDTTVTPLNNDTHCSRVSANVSIPLDINITDAQGTRYQTHSSIEKHLNVILYIPRDAAFPYTITSEAVISCDGCQCDQKTTTMYCVSCKILTRVTAVTDLLIPTYGYAPLNYSPNYPQCDQRAFLQQPLFPTGKVY